MTFPVPALIVKLLLFSPVTARITPLISTLPPFVVNVVLVAPISKIVFISIDKVPLEDVIFAFKTVVVASNVKVEFLDPE